MGVTLPPSRYAETERPTQSSAVVRSSPARSLEATRDGAEMPGAG